MAITYNNPDEVAKVKHILSLAEHIAEKINGSGDTRAIPTISSSVTTISRSSWLESSGDVLCSNNPIISYNGDGNFWVSRTATSAGLRPQIVNAEAGTNNIAVILSYLNSRPVTFPITLTVGFTETANYKACSVDITLQA